jgi:uncharacterized membrane protein
MNEIPVWLIVAQSIELLLLIGSILLAGIATRAVLRNRLFHWNLRIIMNAMGLSWYGMTLARIVSIVEQFFWPEAMGEFEVNGGLC